MQERRTLENGLTETALTKPDLAATCMTVAAFAKAGAEISALASLGALGGATDGTVGLNADSEAQREIDRRAEQIVMKALRDAPVASVASKGLGDWTLLNPEHPLAVAFEPLDGSSNFEDNLSLGTIFSILPAKGADNPFVGRRSAPLAAGFLLYGPQANLVLTLGEGLDVYTFDRRDQSWRLTQTRATIPTGTREYAINATNYRHWEAPVRAYVDDCLNRIDGPRAKACHMRWTGTLVAEAFRIMTRGGVYLYPSDQRAAYREGRLRLIYEAQPIAFLIEQAGGAASTGRMRILDIEASSLDQRAPLIFGSADQVALIEQLHATPGGHADVSPLFGRRGLFRT
jgi:fructose-1,6-bisphosphatase I